MLLKPSAVAKVNQTRFISPIVVNIQQMGEQKINNF
jgi:hypothetical protein